MQTKGVFMSVASSDWIFAAERVEALAKPKVPYCFVFNQKEPFAY